MLCSLRKQGKSSRTSYPNTPWDCHICIQSDPPGTTWPFLDSPMAVPRSVWDRMSLVGPFWRRCCDGVPRRVTGRTRTCGGHLGRMRARCHRSSVAPQRPCIWLGETPLGQLQRKSSEETLIKDLIRLIQEGDDLYPYTTLAGCAIGRRPLRVSNSWFGHVHEIGRRMREFLHVIFPDPDMVSGKA